MALIVNHSLGMKKGKIAAQVAHGAVSATLKANPELLEAWFAGGQAKVTLKGTDDEQLLYLHEKAKLAGLNSCIIRDAGRTQIPSGSLTVVAIGPALKNELNQITGQMKLL
ncbi:MAG TPA: aminoacyl-tRNA hydrolase [Candidatus Poseidoniales archaeon]|nr:MAG: aminoacyl-tRNA hydrolase [Euryarchaeota archaeon]HIF46017.1 aminoacyl-tRNA hydrolase [Candidatus Poseidoniales archaeon]